MVVSYVWSKRMERVGGMVVRQCSYLDRFFFRNFNLIKSRVLQGCVVQRPIDGCHVTLAVPLGNRALEQLV